MEKVAIGVDIGTTQTKAVVFTTEGRVLTSTYVRYPLIQTSNGMAEQDVEALFQAVVTCIAKATAELPLVEVELISFSAAMHSLILMDAENRPITRAITWADNRAEKYAEELKNTPMGQEFYQLTGVPMHPMTPFHKISWLQTEHSELYQQATKFIGIKDYIFYRFFGDYWTDFSSASGTGYFNIHEMRWEATALAYLNISSEQLPKLAPPTYQLPPLSAEWLAKLGITNKTAFILGGADGPLSNLGLGALGAGKATLTVGTSGALRYIVDQPFTHPLSETFCLVLDDAHWVIGGASSNGAGIFDWACSNFLKKEQEQAVLAEENPYDAVMNKLATVPAGANGLLFHPYLLGERAPLWDAEATGSFIGLRRTHTEADMVRAVVEGICLNMKRILTELGKLGGEVTEIRGTGGFSESLIFRQIMADVLGEPISFTASTEASALGAVLLGRQALGQLVSLTDAADEIPISSITRPDQNNVRIYHQIYPLFETTQQQLSASYHQLAKLRSFLD